MLISPGSRKYNDAATGIAFYDEVLRRARAVPGVQTAAITSSLPPDRQGDADTFEVEGHPLAPGEMHPIISDVIAGPDFFRTLGIPLVKGRYFTDHDNQNSKEVTIVSEGFARRFLPNENALGKRIKYGGTWMEIVGVVGNVKYLGLTVDTDPAFYIPFAQNYDARMYLAVSSTGDAAQLTAALRRDIQSIDPGVTLAQVSTMEQSLALSVSQPRFNTMLLALFAGIALLLAAIGIYGLMAYSVEQRTQEIGIRLALGASVGQVKNMVVAQGMRLAVVGVVVGMASALALTRYLASVLYGVEAKDPLVFFAAPALLTLVALLAAWIPARRASRVDPIEALRYE